MSKSLHLSAGKIADSTIVLPGSKSISNRILLLCALAKGQCEISRLLESDDTRYMLEALQILGVQIDKTLSGSLIVHGTGFFPNKQADLFLGNAGTAFRSLTAALAMMNGNYQLRGIDRMHERPIGDLVEALQKSGANIQYLGNKGYPPLSIAPFQAACKQNRITVRGNVSSQFISALLMALPLQKQAYELIVEGELISKPYVDITTGLMARFGVEVENHQYQTFRLPENAVYRAPAQWQIEGDASSASYFAAAALLGANRVRIEGMGKNSIQGDKAFVDVLQTLGAQVHWQEDAVEMIGTGDDIPAFDLDANHIPDAAMTLAIIALAAKGTSHIRNIASWRVKETDRIAAMQTELEKLGASVQSTADSISITPPAQLNKHIAIDTYDDHRMAMCFSLVRLLGVDVIINNPQCVNKTFPNYFSVFEGMLSE